MRMKYGQAFSEFYLLLFNKITLKYAQIARRWPKSMVFFYWKSLYYIHPIIPHSFNCNIIVWQQGFSCLVCWYLGLAIMSSVDRLAADSTMPKALFIDLSKSKWKFKIKLEPKNLTKTPFCPFINFGMDFIIEMANL